MRFLITVVCVIALFGAVYVDARCGVCKHAVDALENIKGEITEDLCQDTVSRQARGMCSAFVGAEDLLSDALQTSDLICAALGFCGPPSDSNYDVIVKDAVKVVAAGTAVAVGAVGIAAFVPWLTAAITSTIPVLAPAAPLLLFGRRKRDIASTERNMAGIYVEEEDNPFEYMDPTLDPSSDLPEEMDAYMKQALLSLKCELCKLGISFDSSNATLLQTGQDGAPMRKLLCRSLPEKGDQRKCMTVLRQASEIFLQILGSIFGSFETCEGLKSCQVG